MDRQANNEHIIAPEQVQVQPQQEAEVVKNGAANDPASAIRHVMSELVHEYQNTTRIFIGQSSTADDVAKNTKDFDLLGWWKTNTAKYQVVAEMVRDFLVVPITSVASESAFSSGGRLLDPHRSRLHHNAVEALICTRSWLQDDLRADKIIKDQASQLEGLFTLLEVNDVATEEKADTKEYEQSMDIDGFMALPSR